MDPARKPRLPLAIGLLLIAAGIALLVLFTRDPKGALPGMPNAWKGGPMLLGAGFCSIVGTFLIVQRRFSLAGFLVGGLVSAGLAAGANAYVMSVRDVRCVRFQLRNSSEEDPYVLTIRRRTSSERLTRMLDELYARGFIGKAGNFDGLTASVSMTRDQVRLLNLSFEYSPYLHQGRASTDALVTTYVEAAVYLTDYEQDTKEGKSAVVKHLPYFRLAIIERLGALSARIAELSTNAPKSAREELQRQILLHLSACEQDEEMKELMVEEANARVNTLRAR